MSLCRWGSRCTNTFPRTTDDEQCGLGEACPGSSLYLYFCADGKCVCCGCPFHDWDEDPAIEVILYSYDELLAHLTAHRLAGHHFRPSIFREARQAREERYPWKEWGA